MGDPGKTCLMFLAMAELSSRGPRKTIYINLEDRHLLPLDEILCAIVRLHIDLSSIVQTSMSCSVKKQKTSYIVLRKNILQNVCEKF